MAEKSDVQRGSGSKMFGFVFGAGRKGEGREERDGGVHARSECRLEIRVSIGFRCVLAGHGAAKREPSDDDDDDKD
jgi:hypothetical protein